MIDRTFFSEAEPYSLSQNEKENILMNELKSLTKHHRESCKEYSRFLTSIGYDEKDVSRLEDIPYFPVRLFKELELVSVPRKEIIKTTTSSGTTGQNVSKMFIDRETAAFQQKMTVNQLNNFWGKKRQPFLIVDSEKTIQDRTKYSARAAGIMGLRFFSTDMIFCLNEDMSLNLEAIEEFLNKYSEKQFVVFGFTFMVWMHLYKELERHNVTLDMHNAILMTGGDGKNSLMRAFQETNLKQK